MNYIDRNGIITRGNSSQERFLKLLYTTKTGHMLLKLLIRPGVSRLGGRFLDSGLSRCLIRPFIKKGHINMAQYERKVYTSFNDFFTRRIKKGMRPVCMDQNVLISPCDGKLSIYPLTGNARFQIKGTVYSAASLLRSAKLARRYRDGYALVFRLCVEDYHRFCYMADGKRSDFYRIPGVLHTVNPVANEHYSVYKENTREFCLLKTSGFGTLLIMEVGAMLVGRICNFPSGYEVKRGQEKGCFEYGGSTIVVFVQKERLRPDPELLENTRAGFETLVKLGERIGRIWK